MGPARLRPTLWRSCRAIASRARLEMFALLIEQSPQTVSAVAARLDRPLSKTSETSVQENVDP